MENAPKTPNEQLSYMQRRRRRGISLMEGILGGILLAIGAYEVFQNWGGANMQTNIATDQNQVNYLAGNIKEYYKNYNSFNPQNTGGSGATAVTLTTENGVKLHWFQPETISDYSGTTHPQNPWGGEYDIAASGSGNYFAIAQSHIPAQACAMLTAITNDAGGGGVVGTTIVEDSSGSSITQPTAAASATPTYANSNTCANSSNSNSYYTVTLMYGR